MVIQRPSPVKKLQRRLARRAYRISGGYGDEHSVYGVGRAANLLHCVVSAPKNVGVHDDFAPELF